MAEPLPGRASMWSAGGRGGQATQGGGQWNFSEKAALMRRKEQAEEAGLNLLHRETENVAWLTAITHRLNGTELSREEF